MRISDWSSDVCSSDRLAFSTEHGVPRSFSVTSTRPIEGKSTTCLALATTLSRGGKRVILIDGDMRNPSVHHLGGVRHDRGLSNYLTGEDNIDALTFPMEIGRAPVELPSLMRISYAVFCLKKKK